MERQFKVAGVKFRPNAVEVIQKLEEGQFLELEAEENQYAPGGTAVKVMSGEDCLGYVPNTFLAEILAAMDLGEVSCKIVYLNKTGKTYDMLEVLCKDTPDEEELPDITDEELKVDEGDCPYCGEPEGNCDCVDEALRDEYDEED